MHHKKAHMVRAVLEGITMNLYSVLLALEELIGGEPKRIQATGGGLHALGSGVKCLLTYSVNK